MLSPPLDMAAKWFQGHTAYTMAKFGMSMCVLGMAAEFADDGIAFNALWPRTGIATAAIRNALAGDEGMKHCRTTDILSDAAYAIFNKRAKDFTGNFLIDDTLAGQGVTDFDRYRVDPDKRPHAGFLRAGLSSAAACGVSLAFWRSTIEGVRRSCCARRRPGGSRRRGCPLYRGRGFDGFLDRGKRAPVIVAAGVAVDRHHHGISSEFLDRRQTYGSGAFSTCWSLPAAAEVTLISTLSTSLALSTGKVNTIK